MGRAFPTGAVTEAASRIGASKRAAVSATPLKRKLCPGISPQSGAHLPVEPRLGNAVPFAVKTGGPDVGPNRPFGVLCRDI